MISEGSEPKGSDIQIKSTLPRMAKKNLPINPSDDLLIIKKKGDKKFTTKAMVHQTLVELKTRKGVSLYAVKKYIAAKYNVDTEKIKVQIKKFIKSAIEQGTIIQTRGVGVKGSFRLATVEEKEPKTKKPKNEKTEKTKDPEKKKKLKEKSTKTEGKSKKSKVKSKDSKEDKPVKSKKNMDAEKKPKEKKDGGEKTKKEKIAKDTQTPLKKKTAKRRKSISTVIKPPKMRPSAKP